MSTEERLERIEKLITLSGREVLDVAGVALYLGVTEGHVRHLCCDRSIPHYKRGRMLAFRKSEVEDWLLGKRVLTNEEIGRRAATYTTLREFKD